MKLNKNITKQPRKKRKQLYNLPLHLKNKLLNVSVSKELKTQLKKNVLRVKKGDSVKILKGKFYGKQGKVVEVSVKNVKVFVDVAKGMAAKGKERFVGISPANLMIIEVTSKK